MTLRGFAEEGEQVAICARTKADLDSKADETRATGVAVAGIPVDLSMRGELERLIDTALREARHLHQQRGRPPGGTVEELNDDDWDCGIQLKLVGLVRCTRAAIPVMRRQGGGGSGTSSATMGSSARTGRSSRPSVARRS